MSLSRRLKANARKRRHDEESSEEEDESSARESDSQSEGEQEDATEAKSASSSEEIERPDNGRERLGRGARTRAKVYHLLSALPSLINFRYPPQAKIKQQVSKKSKKKD